MNILDPQIGDTYTRGGVTLRVKDVVQDSVEYEFIEGAELVDEHAALFAEIADKWFEALPVVRQHTKRKTLGE